MNLTITAITTDATKPIHTHLRNLPTGTVAIFAPRNTQPITLAKHVDDTWRGYAGDRPITLTTRGHAPQRKASTCVDTSGLRVIEYRHKRKHRRKKEKHAMTTNTIDYDQLADNAADTYINARDALNHAAANLAIVESDRRGYQDIITADGRIDERSYNINGYETDHCGTPYDAGDALDFIFKWYGTCTRHTITRP